MRNLFYRNNSKHLTPVFLLAWDHLFLDRKLSGRQWQQEVIEKGKICVAVFSAVYNKYPAQKNLCTKDYG
jgi:hypothetical protein